MLYIGLDIHWRMSMVCILDKNGKLVKFATIRGPWSQVIVAHPGQLRLIFRSKKKNDRVDAKKLATLLFLDQVPQVHVPSVDVRSWRSTIEFRHRLVATAHYLARVMLAILRSGECWRFDKEPKEAA